jgi:large subunit ribosomal protein L13
MNKVINKVAVEKVIDASGKTLGRVATSVAVALRAKDTPAYERHIVPAVKVKVINASKIFIAEPKKLGKTYVRYSGGLRSARLEEVIAKKGISEPLKLAVYGMLPSNKLRPILMKNLKIEE